MRALSDKNQLKSGRRVLVQMREAGLDAKAAEQVLLQMLRSSERELNEQEEDQIKDIADLVYGHCIKALQVWDKDPNGFKKS